MPYASDYYEERINELELEKERLEEKLAMSKLTVIELQSVLDERTQQRDAYRAALVDIKELSDLKQ